MIGPPPNPRRGRQRHLIRALDVAVLLVGAVAALALVVPPALGEQLAWSVVAVVAAVPVGRVAWLAVRWARLGDLRYATIAAWLIVVVTGGALLAG